MPATDTHHSPLCVQGPYKPTGVYADRASKARWIAQTFEPVLCGRVLDVGCDRGALGDHLGAATHYLGLDLSPSADVVLDLDLGDLPFEDRVFDCVVCTDVLEHLARPHEIFDELCRVSADAVVVSLPNCVRSLLFALLRGEGGQLKHYGLATQPPADRHKWFFGFDDAARFIHKRSADAGFTIEHLMPEDTDGPYWIGPGRKDLLDQPNTRFGTLWSVLRKTP